MATLVFDLDGTLADTAEDLVAALNAALAGAGYGPVPLELARPQAGNGSAALIRLGLLFHGADPAQAPLDKMRADFLDYYEANIAAFSRPYEGVPETLEQLADGGWRLAICTNKPENLARRLLDELSLTGLFGSIVGGNTYPRPKPDALPVLGAIRRAGGEPCKAIMIGDTATDIAAAKAAQIPVIAVDFGYASVPVADLSPDRVISAFADLAAAVETLGITARPHGQVCSQP
ncbi:MAG: HAD-IA family hydrolase [Pannonibacter phragmitetus]